VTILLVIAEEVKCKAGAVLGWGPGADPVFSLPPPPSFATVYMYHVAKFQFDKKAVVTLT